MKKTSSTHAKKTVFPVDFSALRVYYICVVVFASGKPFGENKRYKNVLIQF